MGPDINTIWNIVLTATMGFVAILYKEKSSELVRIQILLNRTREEIARDNVTQAEIDRLAEHIDARFNKLEDKINQLITKGSVRA
jgi:hypothetical protein